MNPFISRKVRQVRYNKLQPLSKIHTHTIYENFRKEKINEKRIKKKQIDFLTFCYKLQKEPHNLQSAKRFEMYPFIYSHVRFCVCVLLLYFLCSANNTTNATTPPPPLYNRFHYCFWLSIHFFFVCLCVCSLIMSKRTDTFRVFQTMKLQIFGIFSHIPIIFFLIPFSYFSHISL